MTELWVAQKQFFISEGGAPNGWIAKPLINTSNLAEWDRIAWTLSSIPAVAQSVTSSTRHEVQLHVKRMLDWVAAGRTMVVIVDSTTRGCFNLPGLAPLDKLAVAVAQGELVNLLNVPTENPALDRQLDRVRYSYVIRLDGSTTFMAVKQTAPGPQQPVAVWLPHGQGHLVLAPPMVPNGQNDYSDYLDGLFSIPTLLTARPAPIPDWANDIATTYELPFRVEIQRSVAVIAEAEARIVAARSRLEETNWFKTLYCGTGETFMASVERSLRELGFVVTQVPGKRTDLLARDGDRLLAVETKGQSGSAKTSDLAQLMRWVADARSTLVAEPDVRGADPHLAQCAEALKTLGITLEGPLDYAVKGTLVIGTFKETPLEARSNADFPDDMLKEVRRADVCAMTGLQLLCLLLEAQGDEKMIGATRDAIFATAGQLPTPEWTSFLSATSSIA